MKKTITLLFLVLSTSIASAQDTLTAAQMREDFNYMMEWKGYLEICKQSRPDMTPCKMIELYTRTDSLYDGYIPVRRVEMNYMEAALQCGGTATFKKMAFRVRDFEIDELSPMLHLLIDRGENLVFSKLIPKSRPSASAENDVLAYFYATRTVSNFHITNDREKHAILFHNLNKSTNQDN